jgi:hypothetical protein
VPRGLPALGNGDVAGARVSGTTAAVPGRLVGSSAVASQLSALVGETETLGGRRGSPQLAALAGSWWKVFESAHSALHVASPYLSGKELGERRHRLAEERSKVARLLETLARDLQAHDRFTRRLAAPTSL